LVVPRATPGVIHIQPLRGLELKSGTNVKIVQTRL
jgi:hypothetical protein